MCLLQKEPGLFGFSDFGRAFYQFYRDMLSDLNRETVIVILGDARNNNFNAVASGARVIIGENGMVLAVPVGEFSVTNPSYRISAFRHTGDFGLNPPFDYSSNYFPDPGQALQPYDP